MEEQLTGAKEELSRVMSDESHPMHALWKGNDPKASEYVDNLYKKAYPGQGQVTLADGIDTSKIVKGAGETPTADTDNPEAPAHAEADAQAIKKLQADLGEEFDTEMTDAHQGAETLIRTLGIAADDLIGAYLAAGGDRVVGVKTLATYWRSVRHGT